MKSSSLRVDSAKFVPAVPFKEPGTSLYEVLNDSNLSYAEILFYLHLCLAFHPKYRFEGRKTISNLFPQKYSNVEQISRKFQVLTNYGYLRIERVLQSESYYTLAPLTGLLPENKK